mgnify:CR=1 FL=1
MNNITRKTVLIGASVQHSVSDILYSELFKECKIKNYDYLHEKLDLSEENFKLFFAKKRYKEYIGISVTIPYKINVMQYLDDIDYTVRILGAINTIKVNEKGKLLGNNTDWYGLFRIMSEYSRKEYRNAFIFGSGGAARAAIFACDKMGFSTSVLYRKYPNISKNSEDLLKLSEKMNFEMLSYEEGIKKIKNADIIINTTPVGTQNHDSYPFNISLIENCDFSGKLFIDAVYFPIRTPLMNFFSSKKAFVIDGLWMMIYQGIKAFSTWHNDLMRCENIDLKKIHQKLEEKIDEIYTNN